MAIASLVLALLTLPLNLFSRLVGFPLGLLGCVPAIFYGHAALGEINARRLRGKGLAIAGLIIGYLCTLLALLGLGVLLYVKTTGKPLNLRSPRTTFQPQASPGRGPFPNPVNPPQPPSMPVPPPRPVDPPVTTDPRTVRIASSPASGTLQGKPFTPDKATLRGSILTFEQGKDFIPDANLTIFIMSAGGSLQGKTLLVTPKTVGMLPHVSFMHREAMPQGGSLVGDYVMRLEFGKQTGSTISGKLYFEAPRSYNTTVSGTFSAEVK
jgi:hypothetical protein